MQGLVARVPSGGTMFMRVGMIVVMRVVMLMSIVMFMNIVPMPIGRVMEMLVGGIMGVVMPVAVDMVMPPLKHQFTDLATTAILAHGFSFPPLQSSTYILLPINLRKITPSLNYCCH
jgi:tetrahydromethanopterin S-methyltransferase subunit C